jgi:outer membrane receptor protein involved in Fe transport
MHAKHIRFIFALLLVLMPVCVFAQSSNGSISGVVTDNTGGLVPGVTVTATNDATAATRSAVSNERGQYAIALLPPGTYTVTSELSGFQPLKLGRVVVNVGTDVALNLTMRVGASETMTVTAAAPLVETSRSQVSTVVNEKAIENLPTNGRNFIDFVLTTPGVVKDVRAGDISFAGQRGTMNSLVIDGANNDNTFFGQSLGRTGSGRAPYQFSQDAVKEFQVNSNGYTAEYGRAAGAVINVVTKSGTNEYHGSVFDFYRDKSLNANNYVNVINNRAKSPYHYDQYGASFGGPIVRDKHFFFANADLQRNSIDNIVILGVPNGGYSTDAVSQAALAKINALAGTYPKEQNQDVYLLKTDSEILTNNHLSFRYNRQKFTGVNFENGNASNSVEHTGNSLVHTDTFSFNDSNVFSNSFFNEVRGQYAKDREPGLANSSDPEARIFEKGTAVLNIGRNTFSPRETTISRRQIADTATYVFANHTMKAGVDVSRDHILNYFPGNFFGSYTFNSLADFSNGKVASFTQAFAGPGTTGPTTNPNMTEYAAFVQDEWHVRPTLTVNAGIRYDIQDVAQPSIQNPDAQLLAAGLDTSRIPKDRNNIGPRVGFAWTPNTQNTLVIRGGYGIFYGRTPSIVVGTAHSNNGINVQTITFNASAGDPLPTYPNIFTSIPTGAKIPKPTIFVFDKDYQNPKTQQASLGVERGLGSDYSLGVIYQFVKGDDLTRSIDLNVGDYTMATGTTTDGQTFTYTKYSSVRPFANFSRIIAFQSSASSRYNGLTFDLQKRFSNNWQARLAYTFSKVKDNRPDATAVVPGTDDAKYIQDPKDLSGDWAYGDNDVRHRVVLSGVWSLDSYANGVRNSFAHALLSGWSISGIASYQTGQPYSAVLSNSVDLNNDGNARNDRIPGYGRNTFRLPSIFDVSPRVTRDINLFAGSRLQLIAEAFNVLNRSNVNGVRNGLYAYTAATGVFTRQTNFAQPTSSSGERIMQLAAKITF